MDERTKRIQMLNDALRTTGKGGRVVFAGGLGQEVEAFRNACFERVAMFKDFTQDRDPHGEHDFGSLKVSGKAINWKIDYYDLDMNFHSEDEADPAKTVRVLSIYFAEDQ